MEPPSRELRHSLESSVKAYEGNVPGVKYFVDRGLSEEACEYFRLGSVENPLPGDESYRGWASIPYIARSGVVFIRYRCTQDHDCKAVHKTKYLGAQHLQPPLFNTRALFDDSDEICICEGEIDTMIAAQAGLTAIGVPGTGGWKPYYGLLFRGYKTVFMLTDNDDKGAGSDLADRVVHSVSPFAGEVKKIVMPSGHDVNSLVIEHGEDKLLEVVGL